MTTPKPTDQAVSALPIHDGRVELLEEIMASPVIDRTVRTDPAPRHTRRWVGAIAAAAAVIAVAAIPLWITQGDEPAGEDAPLAGIVEGSGERAVLTAAGWTVDNVSDDEKWGRGGQLHQGDQQLAITWYPAEQYDSYVTDREHINHPEVNPGEAIEVLGAPARLWAYTSQDHTVIRRGRQAVPRGAWPTAWASRPSWRCSASCNWLTGSDSRAHSRRRYVTRGERTAAIAGISTGSAPLPPGSRLTT